MQTEMPPTPDSLVVLQTKAALLDDMVEELRLYRGFCMQFDVAFGNARLFAPLAAYDALFGEDDMPEGKQTTTRWQPELAALRRAFWWGFGAGCTCTLTLAVIVGRLAWWLG